MKIFSEAMKRVILILIFSVPVTTQIFAQRIVPALAQEKPIVITGGTIHVGNGQVIENGAVAFDKGKITYAGISSNAPSGNATIIDAKGKQIYPGLIAPNTDLGLNEIEL